MGGTTAIVTQEFRGDCGEHGRSLLPVLRDTYNRTRFPTHGIANHVTRFLRYESIPYVERMAER